MFKCSNWDHPLPHEGFIELGFNYVRVCRGMSLFVFPPTHPDLVDRGRCSSFQSSFLTVFSQLENSECFLFAQVGSIRSVFLCPFGLFLFISALFAVVRACNSL